METGKTKWECRMVEVPVKLDSKFVLQRSRI